jgi:ribonuclease Z
MKRVLLALATLVVVAAAVLFAYRGQIALAVMKRGAAAQMAVNVMDTLPDGLHVGICGSGAPLPDRDRGGPCTAVVAGKRLFVVDAGDGAARTLGLMGLGAPDAAVLLTHFHSDHIDGLGNLALQRWAGMSAAEPLPVHGPEGVQRITAGFNEVYAIDAGYRIAHHGADVVRPSGVGMAARPFAIPDGADSVVVLDEDGVKVTAFRVAHDPVHPAVGYRFDYKGRSVVVSGDTAPSPVLAAQARGVDLLVHEALSPELVAILRDGAIRAGNPKRAKIFADIPGYHTSPEDAARLAQAAGAKALLLTHIIPPLRVQALEGPFLGRSRQLFEGKLWIARDGQLYSLPADAAGIDRKSLLK